MENYSDSEKKEIVENALKEANEAFENIGSALNGLAKTGCKFKNSFKKTNRVVIWLRALGCLENMGAEMQYYFSENETFAEFWQARSRKERSVLAREFLKGFNSFSRKRKNLILKY